MTNRHSSFSFSIDQPVQRRFELALDVLSGRQADDAAGQRAEILGADLGEHLPAPSESRPASC